MTALITSPNALIDHLMACNNGMVPYIGFCKEEKAGYYISTDMESLRRCYQEWIRVIKFELAIPRVKMAFIGPLPKTAL